jgi:hypothetical protein
MKTLVDLLMEQERLLDGPDARDLLEFTDKLLTEIRDRDRVISELKTQLTVAEARAGDAISLASWQTAVEHARATGA